MHLRVNFTAVKFGVKFTAVLLLNDVSSIPLMSRFGEVQNYRFYFPWFIGRENVLLTAQKCFLFVFGSG